MTPEQQRIAIASVCGRKDGWYCKNCHCDVPDHHVTFGEHHDVRVGGCGESVSGYGLPDYLNDLNAMHQAEKLLKDDPRPRIGHSEMTCYVAKLDEITGNEGWHATAAQRAEAFLRTLNLWKA